MRNEKFIPKKMTDSIFVEMFIFENKIFSKFDYFAFQIILVYMRRRRLAIESSMCEFKQLYVGCLLIPTYVFNMHYQNKLIYLL